MPTKHWYLKKEKAIPAQTPYIRGMTLAIELDEMGLLTQKERLRVMNRIVRRHIEMVRIGVVEK